MKRQLQSIRSGAIRTASRVLGFVLVFGVLAGRAVAGGPVPVPEIDPGSLAGALTLLTGGLLILTARSRPK